MRCRNRTSRARWVSLSLSALMLIPLLTACRNTDTSWQPHPGRVATLNLTIPRDAPPNLIADYVAQVSPEVIAFQEACVNTTKRIAKRLEERGMHYTVVLGSQERIFRRCGLGDGHLLGASGNALLLANGVTGKSGNVPYQANDPEDEKRGYVYAQTTVHGSPVTVFGTQLAQHVPAMADDRTKQVNELAKAAGQSDAGTNSIIMGDFNTEPNEAVLGKIRAGWVDADPNCGAKPNTGCKPTQVGAQKKLDYIWLKSSFYPKQPGVTTVRTKIKPTRSPAVTNGMDPQEYTDHDLVYADLPKASTTPSASPTGGNITEQSCHPGQPEPCVNSYLLTGSTTGQQDLSVAPSRMYVGSNLTLTKLKWTTWGGKTAQAKGRMTGTNCDPSCAEGKVHDYGPVEIEVFRLANTSGTIRVYTCGRVRKPGKDWGSVDPSLQQVCVKP